MSVNLKPKRVLPEGMKCINSEDARAMNAKGQEKRWATKAAAEVFKLNAKAFVTVLNELPAISPLDVMQLAIHQALADNDFESAAKYASMLAEYQTPKLARLESNITTRVQDLSDDELNKIAKEEGLLL
jgi:hypothetical protein